MALVAVAREQLVYGAALGEHELEAQHGDEARYRVGEYREGAPDLRAFYVLLVEDERDGQAAEEVYRGRDHGPDDVPAEDLAEGAAHVADAQYLLPGGEAPAGEHRVHDFAAEVREGDEDHEHNGRMENIATPISGRMSAER